MDGITKPTLDDAWQYTQYVVKHRIHRSGKILKDASENDIYEAFLAELVEFDEDKSLSEAADVVAILFHLLAKKGFTKDDLAQEIVRKLDIRCFKDNGCR